MKKILITTDFNDLSLNACLRFCKYMFKDSTTDYYLLHVSESIGFFGRLLGGQEKSPEYQQLQLEELRKNVKKLYDLDVKPYIRKGSVTEQINTFAREITASLIVAGTSNTNVHAIGANTHRLIRTSDYPIMTVNLAIDPKPIRNIVLPIELYLSSRQKVPYAVKWAKHFNAKITLLIGTWEGQDTEDYNKIKVIGSGTQKFILDKGINCDMVVLKNLQTGKDYADEVIKYINNEDNKADICMVMGRDESTDFALDPRAQDVVRFAKVPVICIPLKHGGMKTEFL
ncbi:MAG: universal stress protein [Bacteroidota bacterium]|nr:universal stress protein [Bacteroidota bacterium]